MTRPFYMDSISASLKRRTLPPGIVCESQKVRFGTDFMTKHYSRYRGRGTMGTWAGQEPVDSINRLTFRIPVKRADIQWWGAYRANRNA